MEFFVEGTGQVPKLVWIASAMSELMALVCIVVKGWGWRGYSCTQVRVCMLSYLWVPWEGTPDFLMWGKRE